MNLIKAMSKYIYCNWSYKNNLRYQV